MTRNCNSHTLSRRDFLKKASSVAVASSLAANSLGVMGLLNASEALGSSNDYKALVFIFLNGIIQTISVYGQEIVFQIQELAIIFQRLPILMVVRLIFLLPFLLHNCHYFYLHSYLAQYVLVIQQVLQQFLLVAVQLLMIMCGQIPMEVQYKLQIIL